MPKFYYGVQVVEGMIVLWESSTIEVQGLRRILNTSRGKISFPSDRVFGNIRKATQYAEQLRRDHPSLKNYSIQTH